MTNIYLYKILNTETWIKDISKQEKQLPATHRGMHASAMKTRSMLQAMTGICGTLWGSLGASVGLPSVRSRSINS